MIPSVLGIIGAEDASLRAGGRKENTWERKRKLTGATVRARDTNVPSSFDADNHVGRNGAPILTPEEVEILYPDHSFPLYEPQKRRKTYFKREDDK